MVVVDLDSTPFSSSTGSGLRESTPTSSSARPPQAPSLTPTQECVAHLTPLTPLVVPPPAAAKTPLQSSSLIPVLLPQHARGGAYAVYLPSSSSSSSSAKPNPLSRPQPTSLVVRSMTFEDKSGQSPTAHCVTSGTKRPHSDSSCRSPLLAKRSNTSFKVKEINHHYYVVLLLLVLGVDTRRVLAVWYSLWLGKKNQCTQILYIYCGDMIT